VFNLKLAEILKSLIATVKADILTVLARGRRTQFNPDVFVNPERYARRLPVNKIVADGKVSKAGVAIYKKKILSKAKIDPIIVVKHPRMDTYAVLDGHHRYYAYQELGKSKICSAVAGDFSSVIFYLTENGYFQPSAEVTRTLRKPARQLHENLRDFLESFANKNRTPKKTG
jgi:hypothetical protein